MNLRTARVDSGLEWRWHDCIARYHAFLARLASWKGLIVSSTIALLWLGTLVWLSTVALSLQSIWWIVPAIALRTFLHTGLFIIAHDAMHRAVFPFSRRVNDGIGAIALSLYALLPYHESFKKHWQHHRNPAREGDPDFHDGVRSHPLIWYVTFMSRYINSRQLLVLGIGMTVIFQALTRGLQIPTANLMWFWVLPILLSSLQLFYFGTYLPHRLTGNGYTNPHHAVSLDFSPIRSFLACYHFGYHWEHHEYPHLAWYELPAAHAKSLQNSPCQINASACVNQNEPADAAD